MLLLTGMSFTHRDSLVRNDRRRDRSGCIHHSRDDYEAPMWRDHKDNSLKEIITLILFRMLYTICHSYSAVGSGLAAVWGSWNNRVCLCAYPCSPCERWKDMEPSLAYQKAGMDELLSKNPFYTQGCAQRNEPL